MRSIASVIATFASVLALVSCKTFASILLTAVSVLADRILISEASASTSDVLVILSCSIAAVLDSIPSSAYSTLAANSDRSKDSA